MCKCMYQPEPHRAFPPSSSEAFFFFFFFWRAGNRAERQGEGDGGASRAPSAVNQQETDG